MKFVILDGNRKCSDWLVACFDALTDWSILCAFPYHKVLAGCQIRFRFDNFQSMDRVSLPYFVTGTMDLLSAWLASRCPVAALPSLRATAYLTAYFCFLAIVGEILPGVVIDGQVLSDGTRKQYKCNGLRLLVITVAAYLAAVEYGVMEATVIADMAGELFTTMFLGTVLISVLLYITGRLSKSTSASLKPSPTSGFIHDFVIGVQLNPTFLGIDLKFFAYRPAMIGWLLLNLSLAAKMIPSPSEQPLPESFLSPLLAIHPALAPLQFISVRMWLYQAFTAIYVVDYFWFEPYMTSTWDIIAENFGFMLVFGDLVWIPFTFSIQAWYLVSPSLPPLTPLQAALIAAVFLVGYAVFRGANRQKHIFKHNPATPVWGKPPRVIGGKLLASGYWSLARHCNYLGDLMLALSYGLPCGFRAVWPYFYFIYLLTLLIFRERRDEARCRAKYKDVWEEYCRIVPWRILPFVY